MLPSTPRIAARGLPSNPRPRFRSAVQDDTPDHQSRDDHHNHSSTRSSSRFAKRIERSRTPPLPQSPRPLREDKARLAVHSTHKYDNSESSTTSSLFERMKLGGDYASLRTSPEEYQNSYSTSRSSRKPLVEGNFSQETTGTGEVIWNRLATVASNLTLNVSKAWTAHITTYAGEETPPGQESRLTRAMKAYHLEKARDPNDLPSWLFDKRERPRLVGYNVPSHDSEDSHQRYQAETPISTPPQRLYKDDLSGTADRLKALRDAKRAAATSSTRRLPEANRLRTSEYDGTPKAAVTQRPRVGLPSGPRRT